MTNKQAQSLIGLPTSLFDKQPYPGDTFVIDENSNYDKDFIIEDDPKELKELEDSTVTNIDEVVFNINVIPGAPEDVVLEDDDDDVELSEDAQEIQEEIDSWNWEKTHGNCKFLNWLKTMIDEIPSHSGKDTTGLERAIGYFERIKTEISRAMRKDFKREIDASKAEEAKSTIEEGLKRLNERLDKLKIKKFKKNKKKAEIENSFVKTAETSFTGELKVQVPYFISFLARACVEATIQAGKDMTETFETLSEEYELDKREKVQVIQLIKDMGYPLVLNRLKISDGKIEISDHENSEFLAQYHA